MFIINIPYLDLDDMYNSGQGFLWKKAAPSKYIIRSGSRIIKVNQLKDKIIFDCSQYDFFDYWYNYFDLNTDYLKLNNEIKKIDKDYIKPLAVRSRHLRILNNDLFEVIIASLINASPNTTRIILNNISSMYGIKKKKSMRELGVINYSLFPSPEEILQGDKKSPLKELTRAYRPILRVCKAITNNELELEKLKSYNYKEAMLSLMELNINPDKCKKICLYGLHKMKAFPVDKLIESVFNEIDISKEEFYNRYITKKIIKRNAGLLYQYLWYDKLSSLERDDNGYYR